jgi:hypothetical protein
MAMIPSPLSMVPAPLEGALDQAKSVVGAVTGNTPPPQNPSSEIG